LNGCKHWDMISPDLIDSESLQCFDAVGWLTWTASSLQKSCTKNPSGSFGRPMGDLS